MDNISRGWNDPPPIPVGTPPSGSSTTTKRPGVNLNKRIAFPLSGTASSTSNSAASVPFSANMPPIMGTASSPPKSDSNDSSVKNSESAKQSESEFDSEAVLLETFQNLTKYLQESGDLQHKADVERRLLDMKKMWSDSLLSKELCCKLLLVSQAIDRKDLDTASSLQLDIVSKWPSESRKWAAAVRCLVNHIRLNSGSTNCDDNNHSADTGKQETE